MPYTTVKDGHETVLEDIAGSVRRGAADARVAAENTIPYVRSAVGTGVYWLCYGLSFGAVYTAELAMQVVPDDSPIRRGFEDGARDAHEARAPRTAHEVADPEPATI
jgi:hypothetical protein